MMYISVLINIFTTIITLLVSCINLYFTHKKMKEDKNQFDKKSRIELSSKTRLEWVEKVREITADMMKDLRVGLE